ncbi:Aste57867_10204 [Aphanomyces stellatus]|uniref:Aste57867_10204 protein n=1 Tax=Aphanomyces stellatus TaxID=120398 RepID=A0A485KQI6_9STRA|nr:hypothetical protein As57867_010165 [Aphanomyces stellatus]VFT87080.1 Aste57867_10204 [Aphanomyces stellatus]
MLNSSNHCLNRTVSFCMQVAHESMGAMGPIGNDLDALLLQYKYKIESLRGMLQDVLTSVYDDDLWLLRFILSHGTSDAAEESCRFTIEWRTKRAAVLSKIKAGAPPPFEAEVARFQVAGVHKATTLGEPIFIVRIGFFNPRALMDAIPFDEVVEYLMMCREVLALQCDAESRTKRTLIKMLSIMDFTGYSLHHSHDLRFHKALCVASKLSETMYPQLLGRTVLFNCPRAFGLVFRLVKRLLSQRSVARIVVCPGPSSGKPVTACPYVTHAIDLQAIPTFLGGDCTCEDGCCIGGIPNAQLLPTYGVDADGFISMKIGARAHETIEVPVGKGMYVEYLLEAQGKPLDVRVSVADDTGADVAVLIERPSLQQSDGPISGTWTIPRDGMLRMQVENRHAFLRGRSIKFKLDLIDASQW